MNDLSRFASDVEGAIERGMRKGQDEALRLAIQRSSGTKTASDRRRADYPYAKRHGTPLWDPSVIHRGTGAFVRDWDALPVRTSFDEISAQVVNRNPVADFLREGTRFMFERPIEEAVERESEALFVQAVEAELERVFSDIYS